MGYIMQANRYNRGVHKGIPNEYIKLDSNTVVNLSGDMIIFDSPRLMRLKNGSDIVEEWNGFTAESWSNIVFSKDGKKVYLFGYNCKSPNAGPLKYGIYEITLADKLSESHVKEHNIQDELISFRAGCTQIFMDKFNWLWITGSEGVYLFDFKNNPLHGVISQYSLRGTPMDNAVFDNSGKLHVFWGYSSSFKEVIELNGGTLQNLGRQYCNVSIPVKKYFRVISNPLNHDEVFVLTPISETSNEFNETCKIGKMSLEDIEQNREADYKILNSNSYPDVLPGTSRNWNNLNADVEGNIYINCSSGNEAGWYKLSNDLSEIEKIEALTGSISQGINCDITGVRLTGNGHTGR